MGQAAPEYGNIPRKTDSSLWVHSLLITATQTIKACGEASQSGGQEAASHDAPAAFPSDCGKAVLSQISRVLGKNFSFSLVFIPESLLCGHII